MAVLCPCGSDNPAGKNFCGDCGRPLKGDAAASELQIVGFSLDGGETVLCEEDDWAELRRIINFQVVKEELGCEVTATPSEPQGLLVLDNFMDSVYCLQDSSRVVRRAVHRAPRRVPCPAVRPQGCSRLLKACWSLLIARRRRLLKTCWSLLIARRRRLFRMEALSQHVAYALGN